MPGRIFSARLKRELYQRVKGDISIHAVQDNLIVDIYDKHNEYWRYIVYHLHSQLVTGLSYNVLASIITKEYKKYIRNKYFKY